MKRTRDSATLEEQTREYFERYADFFAKPNDPNVRSALEKLWEDHWRAGGTKTPDSVGQRRKNEKDTAPRTSRASRKRRKLVKVERPRLYPMLIWTNQHPPKQIHRYVWVEDSND